MKVKRWIGYVLAALLTPLIVGGLRARSFLAREEAPLVAASFVETPAPEAHDWSKPTVAVVLGADVTEITDMVGPYEMFARTDLYNVYAVAPTRASTTLSGGLRVRPHYSFEDLDRLLDGAPPAVVVAPNVPNIKSPENRPVVEWVRRSADAGATSLSWCAGAAVLAEAGLLDGRTATSHWGDLGRLEKEYPGVEWQRGVRWVDHGSVVTSAGITSGIDATLRLLIRTYGEDVARRLAAKLRYPNFRFALEPRAEQYLPRVSDGILFLNAAFRVPRSRIGIALYEGISELDVSTVYDAHAAAGVAEVFAVAASPGLVRTEHGLWLEPALVTEDDRNEILGRVALSALLVFCTTGCEQEAKPLKVGRADVEIDRTSIPASLVTVGFKTGRLRQDVRLKGYDISKTPVVLDEYLSCVRAGACAADGVVAPGEEAVPRLHPAIALAVHVTPSRAPTRPHEGFRWGCTRKARHVSESKTY